jgi:Ca2+/Na+ antiporter
MKILVIYCALLILMVVSLWYVNTRNYSEDQIKVRENAISVISNILIIVLSSCFVYFERGIDFFMVAIPAICYYCIYSTVMLYFQAKRSRKDNDIEKLWSVVKNALAVLGLLVFLLLLSFIIRYWIFPC